MTISLASLAPARAEASRRNGNKSRGPKSVAGKARVARNALKHGMRAEHCLVLDEEDLEKFRALEEGLAVDLAPVGTLEKALTRRVASSVWRLERSDRAERDMIQGCGYDDNLGVAFKRDGYGPRSIDLLCRYRGSAVSELWRCLRAIKALKAEEAPPSRAVPAHTPPGHP